VRGRSSTRGSATTAPMSATRATREEECMSVERSTFLNDRTFDCECLRGVLLGFV
jgi:hypothetical protein